MDGSTSRCIVPVSNRRAAMARSLVPGGLIGEPRIYDDIVRNLQDDTRNDRSWTRLWKDRAEFRCVASTGGTCHVVVFASDCPGAACTTRVLGELTLPAGTSRRLTGLPRGFKHCVAHDAKPVAPTCLKA